MITELTNAQKEAMPKYVQKWIKIGTNTDRLDYDRTSDICADFERYILKRAPTPVVIFNNPLDAWIACHFIQNGYGLENLHKNVAEFYDNPRKPFVLESFCMPCNTGSMLAALFAFYDYMFTELRVNKGEKNKEYNVWQETSNIGYIFPMANVCIVSQKPTTINLNENNVIHGDGRAAITYEGMAPIYALNGTVVPEWLAMTHSMQIDLKKYDTLHNADQKMEFVRKVGIERMLSFGTKIDSFEKYNEIWWEKSKYELWDMAKLFPGIAYAPHVKMLNQTTNVWHVEAVSPMCRTLRDAIKERMGGFDLAIEKIA